MDNGAIVGEVDTCNIAWAQGDLRKGCNAYL